MPSHRSAPITLHSVPCNFIRALYETWATLSSRFGAAQTQFLCPDSIWCSTPLSFLYKDSLDNEWKASAYTEALLSCNTTITYSSPYAVYIKFARDVMCTYVLVPPRSSSTGDCVSDLGIGKRHGKTDATATCLGFCMNFQIVCSRVASAAAEILCTCAESEQGVTLARDFFGRFSFPLTTTYKDNYPKT